VDARSNAVLAEYIDFDMMQCHYIWVPVTNLISLQQSLPTNTMQPDDQLLDHFDYNLQKVTSILSRRTLEQFVQVQKKTPIDELKFEELISWSIWETFGKDKVNGWMRDLPQVLSLEQRSLQQ
jgi:hypothetical protein